MPDDLEDADEEARLRVEAFRRMEAMGRRMDADMRRMERDWQTAVERDWQTVTIQGARFFISNVLAASPPPPIPAQQPPAAPRAEPPRSLWERLEEADADATSTGEAKPPEARPKASVAAVAPRRWGPSNWWVALVVAGLWVVLIGAWWYRFR